MSNSRGDFAGIAPPRLSFLLVAAFFLLISLYGVALSGLGDPAPLWGRIVGFGPLCAITGWFLALALARSYVRGETLYVRRVILTHRVRMNEIVKLETENGLALQLVSGRRIRVVGPGSKARARQGAEGLQQLLGPLDATPGPAHEDTTVTTPRWTILAFTIALTALMVWLSGWAASAGAGYG